MQVIFFMMILLAGMANSQVGMHGHFGVGEVHSAHTLNHMEFQAGIYNKVYQSPEIFANRQFDYKGETLTVNDFVASSSFLTAVMGIGHNFEVSVGLPYYYDYMSFRTFETSGIGDIRAQMKLRLSRNQYMGPLEFSIMGQGFGGTSSTEDGLVPRDLIYYNNDKTLTPFGRHQIYFRTLGAATLDLEATKWGVPLQWHVNSAYTFPVANYPGVIELSTAMQYDINKFWSISSDIVHKTREDFFATENQFKTEHTVLGANVYFTTNKNVTLSVGIARDLVRNGYEQISDGSTQFFVHPERDMAVRASIHGSLFLVPQDQDQDGIVDKEDACILLPEDRDGFEDSDGCPEFDNDQDGIPDDEDSCPIDREDLDGWQDKDGCPEFDNDLDGIRDDKDKCPGAKEDRDGFEDADGCPDTDNDQDNVSDDMDECPRVPEDRDGYQDGDGCPDLDNDGDRIIDEKDKCPMVAENFNNFEDYDGCPDMIERTQVKEVKKSNRRVLRKVRFKLGTANFTFESFEELDRLADEMLQFPKYHYEIVVHTDNTKDLKNSIILSKNQGLAIRSYLISRGLPGVRLSITPMGSQKPMDSNATPRGRAKNRRVEIIPKTR